MATSKDYNQVSALQKFVQEAFYENFERGVSLAVESLAGNSFCVLELGCASGGNSTQLLKIILKKLAGMFVFVLQNDLPTNDFRAVFALRDSWIERGQVAHAVIGKSFYEGNLVLPGSVNFVFSCNSIHWVRKKFPLPACNGDVETLKEIEHDEDADSFRVLIENCKNALCPGGIVAWYFPSLIDDPFLDTEFHRVFIVYAGALREYFKLSSYEMWECVTSFGLLRSPKTIRKVFSEFTGIDLIFFETKPTLLTEDVNPTHAAKKISRSLISSSFLGIMQNFKESNSGSKIIFETEEEAIGNMTRIFESKLVEEIENRGPLKLAYTTLLWKKQ